MARFRSTDEVLQHARELIARLEASGHGHAAAELREGFSRLNGLTDGWAGFLESVERVRTGHRADFDQDGRRGFDDLRDAVRHAVYGRR